MQMSLIDKKARFFKALSDPIRLKIIRYLLRKGQCTCICRLSKSLGRDQSVIFRHIEILKNADIINAQKEGRMLFCCIKDKKKVKKILEV